MARGGVKWDVKQGDLLIYFFKLSELLLHMLHMLHFTAHGPYITLPPSLRKWQEKALSEK